jgi:hypothetical protein
LRVRAFRFRDFEVDCTTWTAMLILGSLAAMLEAQTALLERF